MTTPVRIKSLAQLEALGEKGAVQPLGSGEFHIHNPDTHLVLLDGNDRLLSRCSLWWNAAPNYGEEKIGLIGHFEANDVESATAVLDSAFKELLQQGCTMAIGPMNGNTWRRYRFVTGRGTDPPFFLEPDNPDAYPLFFLKAGFIPLARYFSNLDPDLGWSIPGADDLRAKLEREGVSFRSLNETGFNEELEKIYRLSLEGFAKNFLYTPIGREEFLDMYASIKAHIMPDLVWFAEAAGNPIGFIFAVPDMLRVWRGDPIDTVIFKSMAVSPAWNGKGIGSLFLAICTEQARRKGFRRAIHALMHEDNRSRLMSGHHGKVIREYTLFYRRLR